jgi:hypothetical protein
MGNRNAWKYGDRSAEAERLLKVVRGTNRKLRVLGKVSRRLKLGPSEMDELAKFLLEHGQRPGITDLDD